jgi:membrane-anchored mycosin MYCP
VPGDAPNSVHERFDRVQRAVNDVKAVPSVEAHRAAGGPSSLVYVAIGGLAVLLFGCLAFLWRRARRPSPL